MGYWQMSLLKIRKDKNMFLQELNDNEKRVFLTIAIDMFQKANVDIAESYMFYLVTEELGLDIDEKMKVKKIEDLFLKFSESRSKKIALLELMGLANSEGILDKNTMQYIKNFSDKAEISEDILRKTEQWIIKQTELFTEINNILDN